MSPAIEAHGLTRRFGDFVAVKAVDLEVKAGEIFGYLGANGAGKSTTIRMLCGLLAPSEGRAIVGGADVEQHPEQVKRAIGYMSQRFSLYMDLRAVENLEFFGGAYGLRGALLQRRIDQALELVDLVDHRQTLTGALPGGTRQRLALASALLHEPRILFLDEPTAGVDPSARRRFWRLIRQLAARGTTVFVTTHYMDEAEYCHRIGLMVDGALVALDTPQGLKSAHVPGRLYRLFGQGAAGAAASLAKLEGVIEVQPFGASLHLRADPPRLGQGELERICAGHQLNVEPIEPSLEDVFLAVVEAQ